MYYAFFTDERDCLIKKLFSTDNQTVKLLPDKQVSKSVTHVSDVGLYYRNFCWLKIKIHTASLGRCLCSSGP